MPDLAQARRALAVAQQRAAGAERRAWAAGRNEGALPRAIERFGDSVEHALAALTPPSTRGGNG